MTAHELARILARGPDVPVCACWPDIKIELTAAYYGGDVRYLPADGLFAIGPAVLVGAPDDPAWSGLGGRR